MPNTSTKKLRYIDLGLIEPKLFLPIFEYPSLIPLVCPTIFSYSSNTLAISVDGSDRLDKRIRVEKLPRDIKIIRYRNHTNTVFLISPKILTFVIHYPDTDKFKSLNKAIKATVFKTLREYGIPLVEKRNDVYFLKDGLEKKFFGITSESFIDKWRSTLFSITLEFDFDLANKMYKFDDEKFAKKGDITDIGKIVGGLCEAKPDIDKDKIVAEVIQKIAERFSLGIEKKDLSKAELFKMNKLTDKFNNKEWQLYGKRP